jgi:DNA-binding protein YbaB
MFNKLKQIKDLRDQAKNLQKVLGAETTTSEKNGVKVAMDGNMNIISVEIEKDLSREDLARAFTEAGNDAIKKTQRNMAVKIQQMGGLPGM